MTTRGAHAQRPSRIGTARSRGAVSGLLLMLLGAWGAIIPFIGHYWGYGFTPDNTWQWTAARWWLEVLPGIGAFVAGFLISTTANRLTGMVAGWLGVASGAWFVLGTTFTPLWNAGFIGHPDGSATLVVWEHVGMFDGLGVAIVLFSALALGRFSVVAWSDAPVVEPADGTVYPAGTTATAAPAGAAPAATSPTTTGATQTTNRRTLTGRRKTVTTEAPATSTAAPTTNGTYDRTVATDDNGNTV